jgi:HemY protein
MRRPRLLRPMRRLLALLLLAVLAVGAATVADYPGTVDVVWQGWELNTSVGVLVAALALAALLLWLVLLLLGSLIRLPRRFRRNRAERRRRAGELSLTRGTIALAAGDAAMARRHAERAELLLAGSPLPLMLAAQAAQLGGDSGEARRRYTALLDEKEAAFFGLRGLIGQALKDGDEGGALRLAARARELRPDAVWAFETLLALQTREGRWEEARETLADAARRQLLPAARANHQRGVILHELSRAAERAGERRRALSLAAGARELAADLPAPAARHARLLLAEGRRRAARRAVEQAWRKSPHPELARVWAELGGAAPALELVTWFDKLAAQNPDAAESHVAAAEAALAAQLWGEARRHLNLAIAAQPGEPSRGLCLLMVRVAESEHKEPGPGQSKAAREWFDRALTAPPDLGWVCARCGAESAEWDALCGHCHGFDSLTWRRPVRAAPLPAAALPRAEQGEPLLSIPDGLAAAGQSDR